MVHLISVPTYTKHYSLTLLSSSEGVSSGCPGWGSGRGGSDSVTTSGVGRTGDSSAVTGDLTASRRVTARGLDGNLTVPDCGRLALALGFSVGLTGMLGESASAMVRSRFMPNSSSSWDEPAVSSSCSSFPISCRALSGCTGSLCRSALRNKFWAGGRRDPGGFPRTVCASSLTLWRRSPLLV